MLTRSGQLLSPLAYAAARATGRREFMEWAKRWDPRNTRVLEERAIGRGCDATLIRRFALALELADSCSPGGEQNISSNFSQSQSQLLQDILVLLCKNEKKSGYFVEVGVGSGVKISNTYLLETKFGWKGLLVEPNRAYAEPIRTARNAILETRAAYCISNQILQFREDQDNGEFSALSNHSGASRTVSSTTYNVTTATLDDILLDHGAPDEIDYLSLDTEGSEYEVLQGLNLKRRRIDIFTIEHNFDTGKLAKVSAYLDAFGYQRILQAASRWDAWYIHKDAQSGLLNLR